MTTTFEEKVAHYNKTVTTLKAELSGELQQALQEMLKGHPTVKGVMWLQYTPYFNDGEPCEFSVQEPAVEFTTEHGITGEYGDNGQYLSYWDLKYEWESGYGSKRIFTDPLQKDLGDAINAVGDFMSGIPDEVMLDCFGDHKQVTVTADGVAVEEYDHD